MQHLGQRRTKLKGNIGKLDTKLKFLLRMAYSTDTQDAVVETECGLVVAEKRAAVAELERLENACGSRDRATIERQLEVNPRELLPSLFGAGVAAERSRAALKHAFPSIVFLGKRDRFCSEFAIECAPGVLLAELSETSVIVEDVAALKFSVTGGSARPSKWIVRQIH
jgi:hypothetical protein